MPANQNIYLKCVKAVGLCRENYIFELKFFNSLFIIYNV